jgi:hypothetical protein
MQKQTPHKLFIIIIIIIWSWWWFTNYSCYLRYFFKKTRTNTVAGIVDHRLLSKESIVEETQNVANTVVLEDASMYMEQGLKLGASCFVCEQVSELQPQLLTRGVWTKPCLNNPSINRRIYQCSVLTNCLFLLGIENKVELTKVKMMNSTFKEQESRNYEQ